MIPGPLNIAASVMDRDELESCRSWQVELPLPPAPPLSVGLPIPSPPEAAAATAFSPARIETSTSSLTCPCSCNRRTSSIHDSTDAIDMCEARRDGGRESLPSPPSVCVFVSSPPPPPGTGIAPALPNNPEASSMARCDRLSSNSPVLASKLTRTPRRLFSRTFARMEAADCSRRAAASDRRLLLHRLDVLATRACASLELPVLVLTSAAVGSVESVGRLGVVEV
mmetsp:Transcript_16224/g.46627  ORF Transcript_16224/g.46627 Transcript_16224/m.46627 type:complete len:225 (-) Transcript_16224:282-956(-)